MSLVNIVIPARNEEEVIVKTLKDLENKLNVPFRIFVVNDKSTDNTEKVVRNYIKRHKKVSIVNNSTGTSGFGKALSLGFSKVKKGYVVFVMADLCDDPKTINKMFRKIEEGWDIVCGSRYMKGGKKKDNDNKFQGFMSYLVNLTLHIFCNIPTRDTSNAFKMYRKEVLDSVTFNPESGVEESMEILGQAYFNGAKIMEVPTIWTGRKFGKSKFKILKRTPRYWRIYKWILINKLRKMSGLKLDPFYV